MSDHVSHSIPPHYGLGSDLWLCFFAPTEMADLHLNNH